MSEKTNPIGIIDSGIGGFSVARKVRELLPNENLLYIGDGANTPYGNHTGDEILTMTRYMLRFMEEQKVKALIVACNTISCLIDRYRDDMSCPVFSVVQAGADAVKELDLEKVGLVATCFTVNSNCYPDLIGKSSPKTRVISHGCPDLASVVERCVGRPETRDIIDAEVKKDLEELVEVEKIQYCVLGCTHYPLIEENVKRLYPELKLIDPAQQMAKEVGDYLKQMGLENDSGKPGTLDIYTTSSVEEYALKAGKVGLKNITSVRFYPPMKL